MVSCGGDHTIILSEEGKAYSFGLSTNGQLGLGTRLLEAPKPVLISALANFKLVQVTIS
jgi:alpha-tubulin suppressor-like RCC1 family protein